jgi:glycosyltransferase involved in cell wall biosynthesis
LTLIEAIPEAPRQSKTLDEPAQTEEPLAVLFVAFQTGRLANGGLQSLTEILTRLRRVRPILVTQIESPVTERWRALGFEVHVWDSPWPRSLSKRVPGRLGHITANLTALVMGNVRLLMLLRSRGIRVVHCNDGWASLIATVSARAADARVVLNIRDTLFGSTRRWTLMRALSDRVIVLSHEMSDCLERVLALPGWAPGWAQTPISSIYSIVDTTRMHPALPGQRDKLRLELGIRSAEEVAVGVIGALVPKKQQLELISYLNDHPDQLPETVRLYFVGDFTPDTEAYCRACDEAVRRGPLRDRIHFVGYAPEVVRWYQALDITLMVSQFEGLARAMIESVACGTPVVAFDFCSAREILEQYQCGLVAPQNDFAGLLARLSELAGDAQARRCLGQRGPALAQELFAPARAAASYEAVYLDLRSSAARHESLPRQRSRTNVARSWL